MREDTIDSMSMSLKGFKPGEIEAYVGGLKGPKSAVAEPPRVPDAGEGYTIGIDWAKPGSEESVAAYYMGKECAPVYRAPRTVVCEYEGQSLTFNGVECTTGKQDCVVCPTTGRKLDPNTLLPIEEHVDFTIRGIL